MFSHARRLSWSGEHLGYPVRIEAVANPSIDPGVPGGVALIGLVDAFTLGSPADQTAARTAVVDELGQEAFVDAAAVFGNFEMMNRVAEGTGVPIPPQLVRREAHMMEALGLSEIAKSQQL